MVTGKTLWVFFVSLLLVVVGMMVLVSLGLAVSDYNSSENGGDIIEGDNAKTILYQDPLFTNRVVSPIIYELVDCPINDGVDTDEDGLFDSCDNCALHYNPEQRDDDYDGYGNACDLTFDLVERDLEPTDSGVGCNSDLDCGSDGFIGELFCTDGGVYQDFKEVRCNNPGEENSFCSFEIMEELVEDCDDGCEDGECLGGEPEIECSEDLDCGVDGFINNFCFEGSVHGDFEEFSCNNPGAEDSFCSSEILFGQFIEWCQDGCANGECLEPEPEIECYFDFECDDSDPLTFDQCVNPGSEDSLCKNEQIGECTPGETQMCGFNDVGQCRLGTESCQSNGFWGPCYDAIFPSPEICDGLDNNCNGEEDEGVICLPAQCDDGIDNDGDGFIDWPSDAGCDSREDDSETPYHYHQCNDGEDNDGDGFVDYPEDPSCSSPFDNSESPFDFAQCDDGIDNDGDGFIDWPSDSQCSSRLDNNETL
jgi:hypothetical protein